jgi:hypothetical protein
MKRRAWAAIVVVPLVLSAAACANSSGDISASAVKVLKPAVQDVREAAATGTYADLRRAVQRLKDLVNQEEQSGDVSSQRAVAIENAADVLLQDARPTSSPTPSPTSESPTPSPTTTSESPTPSPTPSSASPTPTSASPSPSDSKSPLVSVSGNTHKPKKTASPSPSSSP